MMWKLEKKWTFGLQGLYGRPTTWLSGKIGIKMFQGGPEYNGIPSTYKWFVDGHGRSVLSVCVGPSSAGKTRLSWA